MGFYRDDVPESFGAVGGEKFLDLVRFSGIEGGDKGLDALALDARRHARAVAECLGRRLRPADGGDDQNDDDCGKELRFHDLLLTSFP